MTLLSRFVMFAGAACVAACSSVSPTPSAEAPKVAAEASRPAATRPVEPRRDEQPASSASNAPESPAPTQAKTPAPLKSTAASSLPKAPTAAPAVNVPKAPSPKPPAAPEANEAKAPPVAQAAAPKPAPLNLKTLEQRLKDTNAIGVLTKLSLKNQVDDLVGQFRAYHDGRRPPTLAELRPGFELLLMKVLSLLQDKDAGLARDINASRDAIWTVLADKQKFAEFS